MLGKKLIKAAAGAAGGNYWISLLGGASQEDGYAVAVDSGNNIIVGGYSNSDGGGTDDWLVAKFDSEATLLWSRTLGNLGNGYVLQIAIDSSDNIILAGYVYVNATVRRQAVVAKYNSSGTLQWQKFLGGSGATEDYFISVAIDSSDNIICVGYTTSDGAGSHDGLIAKYNSSGTLQWDRTLGGAANDYFQGVVIDSSDNIYVSARSASDGAGSEDGLIVKYNSSGTLQWDRTLGDAELNRFSRIVIDSSGDIIVSGVTFSATSSSSYEGLIAKYNSSGTLQWQKGLEGINSSGFVDIATDSSNNYYVVAQTSEDGAGGNDLFVAKYNSSGAVQWQRTLGASNNDVGWRIAIDNNGDVIVCGTTASDGAGANDLLFAKLPADGSRTGTYGAFTYEATTFTENTLSLTDDPAVLTDDPAVLTDSSGTFTDASVTLTDELIPIT